jgi:hypothetical protein
MSESRKKKVFRLESNGTRSAQLVCVTRGPLAAAPFLAISFTLLWSFGDLSAAGSATQSFERILAKSNGVAPPPYRALRRIEGGVTSGDKRAWLEAWTEYKPGRGFTYEVVREGGSEYVRNKILRHMLETERDLISAGKRLRASFEEKNYAFEDGGLTDSGLQRILLKPVKKSEGLVNGSVLVDPDTGMITRIQGRLVKSPSFWVRDVDVTWKFACVGGHIVPVEMTSTGRVRMFGRSNFKMTYDYVSIDGQPMSPRTLKASLQEQ